MVYLKDIFDLLATGEFSNIKVGNQRTGSIHESEYDRVVRLVNLGINEIYKRILLSQGSFNLHVDPAVTTYYLRNAQRAILADIDTTTYIEVPVVDATSEIRIVELIDIFYTDDNDDLATYRMNNRYDDLSVSQMAPDTLKVSGLETADTWEIVYKSKPANIILASGFDLDAEVVDIPDYIIDALINFVAWRTFKPIGRNDSNDSADKGNVYQQQYELAMTKLEMYGLDVQEADDENTFERDGWA